MAQELGLGKAHKVGGTVSASSLLGANLHPSGVFSFLCFSSPLLNALSAET